MKTLTVADFKSHFSRVIEDIEKGEEITVTYGKNKQRIAVIIPYKRYIKKGQRPLGLLEKRAAYKIKPDFKLSEEEFLKS